MTSNRRVEHVGSVVRDLEKSRQFYEGLLGFKPVKILDVPATKAKLVYLDLGGFMVELIWFPSNVTRDKATDSLSKIGIHHICIFVEDVEAIMKKLKKQGVQVRDEVAPAKRGGKKAFIYDPDGVPIEFVDH